MIERKIAVRTMTSVILEGDGKWMGLPKATGNVAPFPKNHLPAARPVD